MLGRSREFAAAGAWFVYENNGVEILESKGPIRTKLKVEVNESLLSLLNIIDRKFVYFFFVFKVLPRNFGSNTMFSSYFIGVPKEQARVCFL